MVMMVVKNIAELQLVFPALLQPLDNAELFEERNCAVDPGTVNLRDAAQQLLEQERLLVLECLEYQLARPGVGVAVAIAVIAHDFSDGLNTVTLMLVNRNNRRKAFVMLLVDALAPVLGALVGTLVHVSDSGLTLYLAFFAGFLLYIGASEILPEAHSKHSSYATIGLTILGVLFMFFVTRYA
jgi:hypothetical protein